MVDPVSPVFDYAHEPPERQLDLIKIFAGQNRNAISVRFGDAVVRELAIGDALVGDSLKPNSTQPRGGWYPETYMTGFDQALPVPVPTFQDYFKSSHQPIKHIVVSGGCIPSELHVTVPQPPKADYTEHPAYERAPTVGLAGASAQIRAIVELLSKKFGDVYIAGFLNCEAHFDLRVPQKQS